MNAHLARADVCTMTQRRPSTDPLHVQLAEWAKWEHTGQHFPQSLQTNFPQAGGAHEQEQVGFIPPRVEAVLRAVRKLRAVDQLAFHVLLRRWLSAMPAEVAARGLKLTLEGFWQELAVAEDFVARELLLDEVSKRR